MSLLARIKRPGPSGFGYASTAEEVTQGLDLSGKTVLLTGATAGLGRETLRVLTMRGAEVIATGRTLKSAQAAGLDVGHGRATPVACDLSDFASIRAAIDEIKSLDRSLDVVLCNAGIMALPTLQQKYGYELQFVTNHIGHFALVTNLLDVVAEDGRIVVVSSSAHRSAPSQGIEFDNLSGEGRYHPWRAYGQAKLANLLFARELARRLVESGAGLTVNALHPGVIQTRLARHMSRVTQLALSLAGPLALKTIPQGAATQCFLAAHPTLSGVTGRYFADCNEATSSANGQDLEMAAKLWEVSEEILASNNAL